MNNHVWPSYSSDLCNALEIDHFEDEDVKHLLNEGVTSSSLLEAAHLIQQKEKSPLLKLNLDMEAEEDVNHIENLPKILEIACSSGTMQVTLDCIESDRTRSVMLKVQAPFSALMMLIGSNRTFKWICAHPREMHWALQTLTEKTFDFCREAISRGVPILSLADPSGMLELLGEKRYQEFCAFYAILLLRKLMPYLDETVVHICPRTSLILERLQLIHGEMHHFTHENYAGVVLQYAKQREVHIMGHRCINLEHSVDNRAYILTLNPPASCILPMEEKDWSRVSEIYNEGIQSKKATIVKILPEKEQWLAAHSVCLVAKFLGNIIGFIALSKKEIPEVSVYIEKDFQGQGVGTALLKALQSRTTQKIRALIFENNVMSIRLHEGCGFENVGTFCFAEDERRVRIYEWEAKHEHTI